MVAILWGPSCPLLRSFSPWGLHGFGCGTASTTQAFSQTLPTTFQGRPCKNKLKCAGAGLSDLPGASSFLFLEAKTARSESRQFVSSSLSLPWSLRLLHMGQPPTCCPPLAEYLCSTAPRSVLLYVNNFWDSGPLLIVPFPDGSWSQLAILISHFKVLITKMI